MADITMCKGTNCRLKDECYRHIAPESKHRQSWFVVVPYGEPNDKDLPCEHFWKIDLEKKPGETK